MMWRGHALGAAALLAVLAAPLQGAGFGIFEHGSKAMGMAGAFTAQADDGSAIFHNVGGLGFLEEKEYDLGVTLITSTTAEIDGLLPYPGPIHDEQDSQVFYPLHFYYVRPLHQGWTFGFGINTPFGLSTKWDSGWAGRFLNVEANLRTFDLTPSLGWKVNDHFSLGFGAIYRLSDVSLERRIGLVNPFNNTVADVAGVKLDSDLDDGFGWTAGFLHKVTDRWSWGFSYRSKVKVSYGGDGKFTQIATGNPIFDAVVASRIPFDQNLPVRTGIEFPDMSSLGVAFRPTDRLLIEVDLNWTGWSTFQEIRLTFPENPEFSSIIPENYDDAYNYRLGISIAMGDNALRFGYVYDETPQPDESVGPLLPDADRQGFTIGYGWHDKLDLALMYLPFKERTSLTNLDQFFGTYNTTALLFGATVKF